ncbi:hypothetical protein [Hufsiella ginkgonis]|uniref:Uncharacterized protein n=1 Tax=Hufsiella ginkgonis TaxID=2695274 RepID=A0A7K1XYE8_9SPHI|nr:hypothetical protein [Hufsiella ginkgonis]MXV15973.1 hypothetical protein [Hufsiella ginkgonis]
MKTKKILSFLIGLFITGAVIHSCKKDDTISKKDHISGVKNWYEQAIGKKEQSVSIFKPLSDGNSISSETAALPIIPDWESAIVYQSGDSTISEIPVGSTKTFAVSINSDGKKADEKKAGSFLRLIFIESAGTTSAFYMTVIGDKQYLAANPGSLVKNTFKAKTGNFSGTVLINSLSGQLIGGNGYKDGAAVSTIHAASVPKKTKDDKMKLVNPDDCVPFTIDWYWYECDYLLGAWYCDETYMYSETVDNCPTGGGGSEAPPKTCLELAEEAFDGMGWTVANSESEAANPNYSEAVDNIYPMIYVWYPAHASAVAANKIKSVELATVKVITSTNHQYQTFTHQSLTYVGAGPLSYETASITAAPYIYPGHKQVSMAIAAVMTSYCDCSPKVPVKNIDINTIKSWTLP